MAAIVKQYSMSYNENDNMSNPVTKIVRPRALVSDLKQIGARIYLERIEEKERLESGLSAIGEQAKAFWRRGVPWDKKNGHHDIVSEADRKLEAALIGVIKNQYRDAKILGEESGGKELGEDFWVIDPIDGTSRFTKRGRNWCVVVARIYRGTFDFSMVYVPFGTEGQELYYAKRGKGAYVDEIWDGKKRTRKLSVSKIKTLKDASFATNQEQFWKADEEVINLSRKCMDTSILGSTSYWLASLAKGSFDVAITRQKRTWDLAGLLLVEEAGGKVTRLDGSGNFDFVTGGEEAKNDVLATNGLLHDQVLKAINTM